MRVAAFLLWAPAAALREGRAAAAGHLYVAPHLQHMTFYTHPKQRELSDMHGWITAANEQGTPLGAVATFTNWSVPSFMGPLPWNPSTKGQLSSPDALLEYDNAENRSHNEFGVLRSAWRDALERWVAARRPLFANGTARGVFLGDVSGS
jgi:hypothetical protein